MVYYWAMNTKGQEMENLTNLAGATPKQQDFIADLLAKREYTLGNVVINSPKEASELINALLQAPYKTVTADSEALASLPNGMYAVPFLEAQKLALDENVSTEYIFIAVKTYKGTKYLRRLHGSVGDFTRTKMSKQDTKELSKMLNLDPYKYTKLFGELYSCCGKCGAPLTDDKSRQLMLGPVCRKEFGF